MIDPFVLLAPVLLLAVVGLLRFLGCVAILGDFEVAPTSEPPAPPPTPPVWVGKAEKAVLIDDSEEPSDRLSTLHFGAPVVAGNLIVVWVWYIPPAGGGVEVAEVYDSAQHQYTKLFGPTQSNAAGRPEIWYTTIKTGASSLVVTARFEESLKDHMEISAHCYSGPKVWTPGMAPKKNSGTFPANPMTCGQVTLQKNELCFATLLGDGEGNTGDTPLFTSRPTQAGNVVSDRVAPADNDTVEPKFTAPAGQKWVMQVVTFTS
jgi:hypothetical protein